MLSENIQLADKIYFKPGILNQDEKDFIIGITNGDNTTKLMCDLYFQSKGKWNHEKSKKSLPNIYDQLLKYNKNYFPIKGFDLYNKNNNLTIDLFETRNEIIKGMAELPSIAIRNLKDDIRQERDYSEFEEYKRSLTYFLSHISYLANRNEKMIQKIYNKMFKSNTNMNDLVHFVGEKENLLGGANITKKQILDVIKNNHHYELDLVYNKGNIMVVDVTGPNGIKDIGCTSLWCFTYGSGFDNAYRQWNNYSYNDHVYVIIDFSEPSDSAQFMHVLIGPLLDNYNEDNEEKSTLFDMANDKYYDPIRFMNFNFGKEDYRKIFHFDIEPEEQDTEAPKIEKPFVDPNQLKIPFTEPEFMNELRKLIRKKLLVGINLR